MSKINWNFTSSKSRPSMAPVADYLRPRLFASRDFRIKKKKTPRNSLAPSSQPATNLAPTQLRCAPLLSADVASIFNAAQRSCRRTNASLAPSIPNLLEFSGGHSVLLRGAFAAFPRDGTEPPTRQGAAGEEVSPLPRRGGTGWRRRARQSHCRIARSRPRRADLGGLIPVAVRRGPIGAPRLVAVGGLVFSFPPGSGRSVGRRGPPPPRTRHKGRLIRAHFIWRSAVPLRL